MNHAERQQRKVVTLQVEVLSDPGYHHSDDRIRYHLERMITRGADDRLPVDSFVNFCSIKR